MTRVMGADLSSRSMAFALLDTNTGLVVTKKASVLNTIMNRHRIINLLSNEVEVWLRESQADALYIEEPLVAGARNLQSSLKIAQVAGALLCLSAGMEQVYLVPVATWKKDVIGHGGAVKSEVCSWVAEHHPQVAAVCGLDQDLYDAAAIAFYGQGCLRRSGQLSGGLCEQPSAATVA